MHWERDRISCDGGCGGGSPPGPPLALRQGPRKVLCRLRNGPHRHSVGHDLLLLLLNVHHGLGL
eukprot:502727-Alexandrium_andersonii.AAC.1